MFRKTGATPENLDPRAIPIDRPWVKQSERLAKTRRADDTTVMNADEVVKLYRELDLAGVSIWIDGGWAVDAVVGRQTRSHQDLDIAVEAKNVADLRKILVRHGYSEDPSGDASDWNFVAADKRGQKIDIHVVVLDENLGAHVEVRDGIAYPAGSLTGQGALAGMPVRCVCAEFLLEFKTSYPPRLVDRQDVAALCALLGKPVPDTHRA